MGSSRFPRKIVARLGRYRLIDWVLERVRRCALEAFEHRDLPFEQVMQTLGCERTTEYTPVFQVLFALQNAPMGDIELDGLHIVPHPPLSQHSPFDLVLSMEEIGSNPMRSSQPHWNTATRLP